MDPRTIVALPTILINVICTCFILGTTDLFADGFHGAAVATKSLDDYLNSIKSSVPDVIEKMQRAEMRALDPEQLKDKFGKKGALQGGVPVGGKIQANLTPDQLRKRTQVAAICAETLVYLDAGNVLPHEFPDFPINQIPKYRSTAKQILRHLGSEGNKVILTAISSLLMDRNAENLPFHPSAVPDLIDLLGPALKSGDVDPRDVATLLTAASGQKRNRAASALASQVMKLVMDNADRATLKNVAALTNDPQTKKLIERAIKARQLKEKEKLVATLESGNVGEVLRMLESVDDEDTRQRVVDQLGKHELTAEEAREALPKIWKLVQVQVLKSSVAPLYQKLTSAVLHASAADTLNWMAEGDAELVDFIWKQLTSRLEKDGKSRREFRDAAIHWLASGTTTAPMKQASIETLKRLKDREAATLLLDAIPESEQIKRIPLGLWPQVAAMLRELTGEKVRSARRSEGAGGDGTDQTVASLAIRAKRWQRITKQRRPRDPKTMDSFLTFITNHRAFAVVMFGMSLTAAVLVVWRLLLNFNARAHMDDFLPNLQQELARGGVSGALALCDREKGMIPRSCLRAAYNFTRKAPSQCGGRWPAPSNSN